MRIQIMRKRQDDTGDFRHLGIKDFENVEDGEVAAFDDVGHGHRSPISTNRKRKAGSPLDRPLEGKQRHNQHHMLREDRNKLARHGYLERDQKRHVQENHV